MHPTKLLPAAALIFLFTTLVTGQTDFRPGFYIDNNLDTIYGLIDYRGDQRNCKVCSFKTNKDSDPLKLFPGEISSYRFLDGKYYISKWVKIQDQQKHVFVEYLVDGIVDLYYLRDDAGDHYLLQPENEPYIVLSNDELEVRIDGKVYLKSSNEYIGMLKYTFADCWEIQEDIDQSILSHESLIDITSSYHDYVCHDRECIVYEKKLPPLRITVAPVAGAGVSSIGFRQHIILEQIRFRHSMAPYLGLQINSCSPLLNERISLQIESGLSKTYHYGYMFTGTTHYDVHLHTLILQNTLAVKYAFPKGRIRPTFAGGLQLNRTIRDDWRIIRERETSDQVITDEISGIYMPSWQIGIILQAGADLHITERHTFFTNLRYLWSQGLEISPTTNQQILILGLGVYF